ncbi:hypothetical protein ACIA6T_35370 [Streptomyces sp. NPDC051740]|uniref:hypothetical protein n=1 Tax=Streptomyces sp. NPDC051740 TaxID=3365673 RepID=UPI0037A85771
MRAGRAVGVCTSGGQVTIKLTSDEALVLSHWLEKLRMTDLSRVVDDPAVDPVARMRLVGGDHKRRPPG